MDDPFPEPPGDLPPSKQRGLGRDQGDVRFHGMKHGPGKQPLLQGPGKIQPRVLPDIGDIPGRKKEKTSPVGGLADAGADHILKIRCGIKTEGGLGLVLGVPGLTPGILIRVSFISKIRTTTSTAPRDGGISLT